MSLLLVYSSDSVTLSHKISPIISSKLLGFIYSHKIHNRPSHSSPPFSHHSISNSINPNSNNLINPIPKNMATCVHASRAEPTKNCDSERSQPDHSRFRYMNYCRPTFSDLVSCNPISQIGLNPLQPQEFNHENVNEKDEEIWSKIVEEAKADVEEEPILSNYYYNSILSHRCLEKALANHLAAKLSFSSLNSNTLYDLFHSVLVDNSDIMIDVTEDLKAVRERDPACISYVQCFLNFKGFLACQAHRIAHKLWSQGRKIIALLIQNRVSEVFAVDIHPGAKIGRGILFDHATGVVIGETAVIGNNVSILHNVTLGGTGKTCGDRHPKIGDGVLIGAGTCVLGNVKIGDGAKIGAGSVVLKEVPPRTTAVGNPARLVGGKENPITHDKIPSLTMDHTSHITNWSDYVI